LTKGGFSIYTPRMNKKPPELHLIDGTTPRGKSTQNLASIPDSIKKRIPKADWLDNPSAWNKDQFIKEAADYLFEVYGIGSDQDKHTLAMLADQVETYISCVQGIKETGIVVDFNDGKTMGASPYITVKNKATTLIIQLMNELGLTPRGRLSINKPDDSSSISKFLRGAKG
jgi:P27 family predicted phage terminase small subunit